MKLWEVIILCALAGVVNASWQGDFDDQFFAPSVSATNEVITWTEVLGVPLVVGGAQSDTFGVIGNKIYVAKMGATNCWSFDGTTWTATPSKSIALVGNGGYASCGNYFYAFGGWDGGYSKRVYRCDGSTWVEMGNLNETRIFPGGGSIGTNLYIFGGERSGGDWQTNVNHLTTSNTCELVAALPAGLSWHPACATISTSMYVMGGRAAAVPDQSGSTNVYKFDGTAWTWATGLPAPRRGGDAAVLNGKLYYVGGRHITTAGVTNVYQFDGVQWREVTGIPAPRVLCGVIALGDHIYCIGGGTNSSVQSTNVYRMDISYW